MKAFAALYESLDRTTSTNAKVAAMAAYFSTVPPADAAWALFFLSGRKIKRLIPSRVLWELTRDLTGWPEWLLEHCYAAVGDFAEAISRAKAAAGDKDVSIGGGADVIRQGLDAGYVDELHIIVAPVILGGGKHLFEDFTKSLDLENRGVRQSRWATFMEFAVRR